VKDCVFAGVDPYLWIKHLHLGIVLVAVHIDDCLVVGTDKDIDKMIECLKKSEFGLKVEGHLTDYLSCRISIKEGTKTTFVMQLHFIKI
jgi:hypothetical protein